MEFLSSTLSTMLTYKRTLTYVYVVLVAMLMVNVSSADAASKGATSFNVGAERVERVTGLSNDEELVRVHVFVSGRETDLIETRHDGCLGYFYGSGVSVRLDSCTKGRLMTVRAVNASDQAKRVRVTWSVIREAKKRGT